jgi:hypothetical protein
MRDKDIPTVAAVDLFRFGLDFRTCRVLANIVVYRFGRRRTGPLRRFVGP